MSKAEKQYIGDGVYAEFDGWALLLTTENGIEATNTIVLETQRRHAEWIKLKGYRLIAGTYTLYRMDNVTPARVDVDKYMPPMMLVVGGGVVYVGAGSLARDTGRSDR